MPPKAKYSKEQIVTAALNIIREEGTNAVSARALGKKLGTSVCPIFTVFENMDELKTAVQQAAKKLYAEYVNQGLAQTPAFKGVGIQYIHFAMQEPKLFQLLFMTEQPQKPVASRILPVIEDNYDRILQSVQTNFDLTVADAEELYRHLWIYSHGIAVLCATNTCVFSSDEIGSMLSEVCIAVLNRIKGRVQL